MLNIIKDLLYKIINEIDAGNSNLSEEECKQVLDGLSIITNKKEKLSKYQAFNYLKIGRATFDNLVKDGKLPKGMKQQGFKELFYYKKDLDSYLETIKK